MWDDVTIDNSAGRHALRVRRTLQAVLAGAPVWGRPKSRQSRRGVPLGEDAGVRPARPPHAPAGGAAGAGAGEGPADRALVFATRRGTPLDRGVVQEQFKNALRRAGLPPARVKAIRFHDLRHFAATTMIDGGETIPTVTRILGHSKQSTTLNTYSHAIEERVRLATGAIERQLRAQRAGPRGRWERAPSRRRESLG